MKIREVNEYMQNLKLGIKIFKKYCPEKFILTSSSSKRYSFLVQEYGLENISELDQQLLNKHNWRRREDSNDFTWFLFRDINE